MGKPSVEVAKHAAAFELFFALGADRSLAEVSRRTGVHVRTIEVWAKCFKWKERLSAREKLVQELVAEKAVQDEAQSRADYLKLCRATMLRYAEQIKAGTVNLSAGDLDRLARLDQFLRGKPSERSELMIGGPAFDKLIDAIAAVVEREVQDEGLRQRLAIGFQEAAAAMGTA